MPAILAGMRRVSVDGYRERAAGHFSRAAGERIWFVVVSVEGYREQAAGHSTRNENGFVSCSVGRMPFEQVSRRRTNMHFV